VLKEHLINAGFRLSHQKHHIKDYHKALCLKNALVLLFAIVLTLYNGFNNIHVTYTPTGTLFLNLVCECRVWVSLVSNIDQNGNSSNHQPETKNSLINLSIKYAL